MEIFKREVRTITVNGRPYSSPEEMPPEVREQFEKAMSMLADKNNNGIPDALEGGKYDTMVSHRSGVTTRVDLSPANRPLFQASWSRSSSSGGSGTGGITLSWPTLLALLATVAVIGGAIVYYTR
jgi:hypothetical protein